METFAVTLVPCLFDGSLRRRGHFSYFYPYWVEQNVIGCKAHTRAHIWPFTIRIWKMLKQGVVHLQAIIQLSEMIKNWRVKNLFFKVSRQIRTTDWIELKMLVSLKNIKNMKSFRHLKVYLHYHVFTLPTIPPPPTPPNVFD